MTTPQAPEFVRLVLAGVSPESAAVLAAGLDRGALVRGDDERAYWRARYAGSQCSPAAWQDHLSAERDRQRAERARKGTRAPRPSER